MPRRIFYGSEVSQHGHWYPGNDDLPVITIVHGGYWRSMYTMTMETKVAKDLSARGFPVWNVEYRRVGEPDVAWPLPAEDVVAAVDYAADSLETGVGQIVVGHSAGATLAVWAAAQRPALLAAISRAGVLDLGDGSASHTRMLFNIAPGTPQRLVEKTLAQGSPVKQIPFTVPVRAIHGDADTAVPYQLSEWFVSEAEKADMDVAFTLISGEGHDEFLDPTSRGHAAVVAAVEEFIRN